MKKLLSITLAVLTLLAVLTACGSSGGSGSAGESKSADLDAFFTSLQESYQWDEGYFVELDDELLAATYPGLEGYTFTQKIARMPMMTSVVSEFVFLEAQSEEDAKAAAAILEERVTLQAEGGAWYPESMEAWSKAKVLINGNYVALIAAGEEQTAIEESWNKLFA